MSLLLDALKRAEQEKARGAERSTPAAQRPALELAPIASNEATASARTPPPPPLPAPKSGTDSRRRALWVGAIVVVLLILAGAGYVWYSISALAPLPQARVPAPRPIAASSPPVALPEAPPQKAVILTPAEPPRAKAPAPPPRRPAPLPASEEPAAALLQPSRAAERPRIAPQVASGYEALRRGDLAEAKRDYSNALAAEPGNLDALLGMATVEARSANAPSAASLYRRALDIDPRNAAALAGLAALSDFSRGEALEQQLQRDIAQQPNAPGLHFMLGNLYAARGLWSQAQVAYFEAHRLDPGNPDILHNLAVSLDRIGQPRLAAGYYRRALEAARAQSTGFDPAAVAKRLAEIDSVK